MARVPQWMKRTDYMTVCRGDSMRKLRVVFALAIMASLAVGVSVTTARQSAGSRDVSVLLEGRAAVNRALTFLKNAQADSGAWCDDPAITGLVVTAMLGSGEPEYTTDSSAVRKGLDYIRSFARENGGIYDRFYANYTTSICAMALVEAGLPEDRDILRGARRYLLGAQAEESEDIAKSDPAYGGWGYELDHSGEGMRRPDMSNTQFAIEAIRALQQVAEEDVAAGGTGEGPRTETELAYDRAIQFLERCQNLESVNDQPWAGNDGGSVYRPGESKAGETPEGGLRSYASMTYAGLKSMVYARLDKADRRVQAAYNWACRHWSVTENPGMGQQGLYYYYLTMARALNAYGTESVVQPDGTAHDWREELVKQLLRVQRADGSWFNENGRWMEQIPELTTAYGILAIAHASAGW